MVYASLLAATGIILYSEDSTHLWKDVEYYQYSCDVKYPVYHLVAYSESMMIQEYGLDGVGSRHIDILPDERGFFAEALRRDWQEFIDEWIVQVNMSYSYTNTIRAWHRHHRGQTDYFLVLKGAMKICAYDDGTGRLAEILATEQKPVLVRVPGHYYHGTKTIGVEPSLTIYFVTRLYDYQLPDEERIPWNDQRIVPSQINGKKNDPRVNQPWDWFYPPHK